MEKMQEEAEDYPRIQILDGGGGGGSLETVEIDLNPMEPIGSMSGGGGGLDFVDL
jgi:hypothetical protein